MDKRKADRLGINVSIKLQSINNEKFVSIEPNANAFEVNVLNLSKTGIAFTCKEFLPLNSFYEANVLLWTKETFRATIEVVRMEVIPDDKENIMYGCRFIGITAADQVKIDVYQMVSEQKK